MVPKPNPAGNPDLRVCPHPQHDLHRRATIILLMLILVSAGMKGIGLIRSHTLEHHERRVTGIVVVVIGILTFFVTVQVPPTLPIHLIPGPHSRQPKGIGT